MYIILTIRQLLGYLIFGLLLLATPLGWYFFAHLPFIKKNSYSLYIWHAIDVLACAVCHRVHRRTISGWTGQWMHSKKRYLYQAKVIDFLFGEGHCVLVYEYERDKGLV